MLPIRFRPVSYGRASKGQSLVEFVLLFPVFLLILMFAIDFGRIYLGWVNLQNMARIAANYAANNPDAWSTPGDPRALRYQDLIEHDARLINCDRPKPFPVPLFTSGTDLGAPVEVRIDCAFHVLTPVIGDILGGQVLLSANAIFPIKEGLVGSVPGGGGAPPVAAPVAAFTASPTGGNDDLSVIFTDKSTNVPTSWTWHFGDGTFSFAKAPPPHVYADPGTYTVTLDVANNGGNATSSPHTITVLPKPTTGPVPDFTGTPRSGDHPLVVAFTDTSTGGPTTWLWTFGDGGTANTRNPSHTYNTAGVFDVTLTVSNGTTTNSQTKVGYMIVTERPCTVPNFAGVQKNKVQGIWDTAGFTTPVAFAPGQNYKIGVQSLPGGLTNPPGGCAATISVGP
jgi:PKD repeat protein